MTHDEMYKAFHKLFADYKLDHSYGQVKYWDILKGCAEIAEDYAQYELDRYRGFAD